MKSPQQTLKQTTESNYAKTNESCITVIAIGDAGGDGDGKWWWCNSNGNNGADPGDARRYGNGYGGVLVYVTDFKFWTRPVLVITSAPKPLNFFNIIKLG